ncbi:Fe/S-dependent 2-methylisocitrate dehydratase AcnD [Vibrio genomosp. F10]|uniref:Fe/S-dependent 2-methylisocitrate dehydratase AcnD n=2 Tax=Vibrio genomosp. F10 TaxID=723171 RepID=UPI000319FBE6|nr:Fe/S-dependent 2-methylisocitrate dehydratase AcnD [Vibrio genomosp. F10]OEF06682.1 Fe/S-dependent 2-methylisocitrate dehydratase AcnD [Vibrio genomosp. F10 str. 9ZB36]
MPNFSVNQRYRKSLPETQLDYFDAREAINRISPGSYETLPYTSRILAEQLVRRCDPSQLTDSLKQIIDRKSDLDFPWYPARVVCHDILGQTALVDLAGLRDAIAKEGGDPASVNPVVETQLIVDHSLAVEHAGFQKDAFDKNRAIEERRNEDRFHFIEWCKTAFKNVSVIPAGNGIMHQINLEKMSPVVQSQNGIAFPDTCVGTDSHTPHVDALGVLAIGVGGLEAETVMLGRPSMMRLPDIVGVKLVGKRQAGITATDIVLAITELLRNERVVSSYLEFFGEGVRDLTIGDRATIANMTPEYGATAGMFYIDEQTINYLTLTGREADQVELVERYAKQTGLWADDLESAVYERVIEFDLSTVQRNLAGPSNPHRRLPTAELTERGIAGKWTDNGNQMPDGAVIIAAITSCTNTSNPRNVVAAALVAKKANELGLVRKPWVKTSFAPGSKVAKLYLEEAGLLPEMEKLGFGIVGYACTTCNGMSGALSPDIQNEIIERDLYTTAVLSGNRNFDGRIHPYAKQAFLASPPLVVAYAIAGTIRFDIEKDSLGLDSSGNPIYLNDLWPSDEEIDSVVNRHVKPEQFNQIYIKMFKLDESETNLNPLYDWREKSTYIRKPPYWEGALAGERSLKNMRPLALLGDNITTDHLSPSNAILASSAAGEYLTKMDVPEEDFNSYATHRGDHLTAQRATFANPKLFNEMVKENGEVVQGSLARVEPEGKVMRMWEAIETYMDRKQPLIIVAGGDYGQGSSRDWAAKGVRLAGVEVIVAEGFERIHRTNLVGMGVLPLEFKSGQNRHTFNLDGSEIYDVLGDIRPGGDLVLSITRNDGEQFNVDVTCRLDTEDEVNVYNAGGVLQRFAQDFLSQSQLHFQSQSQTQSKSKSKSKSNFHSHSQAGPV